MAKVQQCMILLPLLLVPVFLVSLQQHRRQNIFAFANQNRRSLQSKLSSLCEVPKPVDLQVRSTFVASYPGSGAKLTWKLIRAITGLYTGDDHDHNGRVAKGTAVAIKTHFPSHSPGEVFNSGKLSHVHQAILLIRNPLRALPSFHNFLYEKEKGLLNHSTRAPIDEWIRWRNQNFEQELSLWVEHIRWWMSNFGMGGENILKLLVFEYLTSPTEGPKEMSGLFDFFGKTDPVIWGNMVPSHKVNCIWDMMVKGRNVPGEKERRKSLRSGPTDYPYTISQLDQMVQSLTQLRLEYLSIHPPLVDALDYYLAEIERLKSKIQSDTINTAV